MVPVETIPRMGEGGIKENGGGGEFNYDIYWIYCRNFCKCHNIAPPSITIIKKR
jgi:hypothetical protein